MTKYIHIHAKCNLFEIFEQVCERKAVRRLTQIKNNFKKHEEIPAKTKESNSMEMDLDKQALLEQPESRKADSFSLFLNQVLVVVDADAPDSFDASLAAPAIIRVASLMAIKVQPEFEAKGIRWVFGATVTDDGLLSHVDLRPGAVNYGPDSISRSSWLISWGGDIPASAFPL